MSGILNWFTYKTDKEREADAKRYKSQMFPYEGQKEWVEKKLKENIRTKVSESEKMFQYLLVKEALLSEEEDKKEELISWNKSTLMKHWKDEDKAFLIALIDLELASENFESFPEDAVISEKTKEYLETLVPELNAAKKRKLF